MLTTLAATLLLPFLAHAQTAQVFAPPAPCPVCTSENYVGQSNGSLPLAPVVPGKAYDRFITVWLENTDISSALASPTFQSLASQGILLSDYNGVTHTSEPNYVAAMAGDFFGMYDDDFFFLPYNVSSMVDLLEAKNISWATYQENMPSDAWVLDFAQPNYLNASAGSYTYYKRKHNPHVIFNTVASVPDRALRIRNFNDFAVDVNASAIPQHVWITPNLVNDAHDTSVDFCGEWLAWWLPSLLNNTNFNDNRTLIQVTFDENESYGIQNTVWTLLLGGVIPENLRGTNDSTFYTHYSMMSSVQNNWGLGHLGRQDTNQTVAAVWDFQANITGYTNYKPTADQIPLLNLTDVYPGPTNYAEWTPILAPNMTAVGAGGGPLFYNQSATDTSMTSFAPINLTAMGALNPENTNPNFTYTGDSIDNSTNKPTASAEAFPVAGSSAAASGSAASGSGSAAASSSSAATSSNPSGAAGKLTAQAGGSLLMAAAAVIAVL